MISELVNHLWQSTLFAGVMDLLALILRKNRAAVRHGLWLAASVKFLVPFSLLIGLGSQVEWRRAPTAPEPRLDTVLQIRGPIAIAASPSGLLRQKAPNCVPAILFGVWLCRFAANSLAWWRRWRQVRAGLACRVARAFEPANTGARQLLAPGAGRVRGLSTIPPAAGGSEGTSDSAAV